MAARRRKLYLDSSILGFALNRCEVERRTEALLLRQIREGLFLGGYSHVMEVEVDAAPGRIGGRLRQKIAWARLQRVRIPSRSRAYDLACSYCEARVIPREFLNDALHLAVAIMWRADALVSYNFTHLVRLETMVGVNEINREQGLAEIFICQPAEVILR